MIIVFDEDKRSNHSFSRLDEISRRDLITKSRRGSKKRYQKRLNYQVSNFKGVDLDKLFNDDYLVFNTPIKDYVVTLAFPGALSELRNVVKSTNGDARKINYQMVLKALRLAFDKTDDVKVRCTCADFCLTSETKIKLLEGKDITVEELLKEFESGRDDLWVYSVDEETHDFRPGHVSDVWLKGYVKDLVEVTLDNGEVVRCTPDHLFMLRDGTYKKAEDLEENQSLMPLYFQCNKASNGYDIVKFNSRSHGYNSVYKEVAKYVLQDQIEEAKERSGEDSIAIHHKNFNKRDNRPENLYPMGRNEHWKYHANFVSYRRKHDKEFDKKLREAARNHCYELNSNPTENLIRSRKESGQRLANSINNDPEKRSYATERARESQIEYWSNLTPEERSKEVIKRHSSTENFGEIMSEAQKKVWDNYSEEERNERNRINGISLNGKNGEKASERVKSFWVDVKSNDPEKYDELCKGSSERLKDRWKENPLRFTKGRCRKVLQRIVNEGLEMTEENYFRLKPRNAPRPDKYWSGFHEMVRDLGFGDYNHYVVKVEKIKLEDSVPVYDLTVDNYNNFLLSAGVIVHNCYRFMYWADHYGYLYGPPTPGTEEFPDITNPDDNLGATCKHLDLFLSNKRWLIKAASVVNALIKTYPDKASVYLYDEDEIVRDDDIEDDNTDYEVVDDVPDEDEVEVEVNDDLDDDDSVDTESEEDIEDEDEE